MKKSFKVLKELTPHALVCLEFNCGNECPVRKGQNNEEERKIKSAGCNGKSNTEISINYPFLLNGKEKVCAQKIKISLFML